MPGTTPNARLSVLRTTRGLIRCALQSRDADGIVRLVAVTSARRVQSSIRTRQVRAYSTFRTVRTSLKESAGSHEARGGVALCSITAYEHLVKRQCECSVATAKIRRGDKSSQGGQQVIVVVHRNAGRPCTLPSVARYRLGHEDFSVIAFVNSRG